MRRKGVPTIQASQLNGIVHYLLKINTIEDLWLDKESWPQLLDSKELQPTRLSVSKLRLQSLIESPECDSFLKLAWEQLNRNMNAGMFGNPIKVEDWVPVKTSVWTIVKIVIIGFVIIIVPDSDDNVDHDDNQDSHNNNNNNKNNNNNTRTIIICVIFCCSSYW